MNESTAKTQTVFRLPLRVINDHFGGDAVDEAGDFLVNNLRELTELPVETSTDFAVDTSHQNPWFHSLLFTVGGPTDAMVREFVDGVRQEGVEIEVDGSGAI